VTTGNIAGDLHVQRVSPGGDAEGSEVSTTSPAEYPAYFPNTSRGMSLLAGPAYSAALIPAETDLAVPYPAAEQTQPAESPRNTRAVEYLTVALGGAVVLRLLSPRFLRAQEKQKKQDER
jgi:hypothetical protein